ncbi:hypothetical protein [Quatrionicoccus australiensis]|uniref:hypothetical protein n=1 Tax=Quatrionicoccus australiensis TaxID=138118 RepID=UPI001CF9A5AD|nr:hypothetical protein [Quatrionicoccus australiensis]MCB4358585.1 hypothetical protein [Quatrionicoccus australiensis]
MKIVDRRKRPFGKAFKPSPHNTEESHQASNAHQAHIVASGNNMTGFIHLWHRKNAPLPEPRGEHGEKF